MLQKLTLKRRSLLRSALSSQPLLRNSCFRAVLPHQSCPFATSFPRSAPKKARSALKNPKIPATAVSKPVARPASSPATSVQESKILQTYRSFAEKLAGRQSPTLLYQASSHKGFTMGSYALGAFCWAYAGINFFNEYLHPPAGVMSWIPIMFGTLCVIMTGFGTWFIRRFQLFKPVRIIRTINAIPPSLSTPRTPARLMLQIEPIQLIPLWKRAPFMISLEDASLSSPLFDRDSVLFRAADAESNRRYERMRELNKTRIMTLPFREMGFLIGKGLRNISTMFRSDQFIILKIKGRGIWKINGRAAWALENGKAIDKLVKATL